MYYIKKILLIFFIFSVSYSLYSEEPSGDGETTEQDISNDEALNTLFYKTLGLDIETADYYALLSWCQRLGIDETGDKETLKKRLYEFYNVSQPDEESAGKSGGDIIIIRSANNSEYFTIDEVDEDYLVLQGDVILEFTSNKSSKDPEGAYTTHIVEAQKVVINQTKHILTATGDIKYTLSHENSNDEPEEFYGNTFTFNIDSWNGVFIQGGGETVREVEQGKEVNFFYVGETLTRMDNDIVLLEDGLITSCDEVDDPHWHIKASKIWVLAPGEWAIMSGVFHVGRVPIMYIPFFFKSGDEVFFHPSFGYKKEEGVFIQTTTYVLGQKQTDPSSFSFLRETGYDNEDYNMDIYGLFLRRGERKEEPDKENYVFKIAMDYYTRLGFFSGLAVFPKGFADTKGDTVIPGNYFALNGGLGVSRSIFQDGNSYSPYLNNELKSYWHYISYFGLKIPLRCGLKTKFIFSKGFYSLDGELEFYSDPFFTSDFYEREEEFNWDRFFNREIEEGAVETNVNAWDFNPEEKSTITWQLNNSFTFNLSNQYLKKITIDNIDFYMTWITKNDSGMTSQVDLADPTREFYYPTSIKAPNNLKISLSGELLHLPLNKSSDSDGGEEQESKDPGMGIHLPESEENVQQEDNREDKTDINFRGIDIMEDERSENNISRDSSFILSYSIEPGLLIETQFLNEDWNSQDDVDFEVQYTNLTNINSAKVNYNLNVWNSFVKINGIFGFSSTIKKHFNRNDSIADDDWNDYIENDYSNSGFNLNKDFDFTISPLMYTENFFKSNIEYKLNWDYLKYEFNRMSGSEPVYDVNSFKWNDQYVNTHRINNHFIFSTNSSDYFYNDFNLPPKLGNYDWEFNYKLDLYSWYLNSNVTFGYTETTKDIWEFELFGVTETFDYGSWVNLIQTSKWDFNYNNWEEAKTILNLFNFDIFGSTYFLKQELTIVPKDQELNSSVSTINFRDLTVSFSAEMLAPVELDLNNASAPWQETGEDERFQPKFLSISYSHTGEPHYIWKNRIEFFINIHSTWDLYFYKFTDSNFSFGFDLTFNIYKFMDFYFGMDSYNNYSYRYIPGYAEEAEDDWVNPLIDILKSLNIFNKDMRYESNFKLDQITIGLVHHLHDWDLTFDYEGVQEEVTYDTGSEWEWRSKFSIILEWNPIPEIKHKIFKEKDDDDITFRG